MTTTRGWLRWGLLTVVIGVTGMTHAADRASNSSTPPALVNYTQLGDIIKKQRGKVLMVDLWNIY